MSKDAAPPACGRGAEVRCIAGWVQRLGSRCEAFVNQPPAPVVLVRCADEARRSRRAVPAGRCSGVKITRRA